MERERTLREIIYYAVYLVFEGLCPSAHVRRQCVHSSNGLKRLYGISIRKLDKTEAFTNYSDWAQGTRQDMRYRRDWNYNCSEDASLLLFIAYEPFEDRILGLLHLAWTPNSLSVELFLKDLVKKYGRHPVWTDAGRLVVSSSMRVYESETSRLPSRFVAVGGHRKSCPEAER